MLSRIPKRPYHISETLMSVGPRMTTNSTGRKNSTIGTVSIGGSDAAFFSASRHARVAIFLRHHAQA